MRIVNPGTMRMPEWWIGLLMICPTCKREGRLEARDDRSALWLWQGPRKPPLWQCRCGDCMHAVPEDFELRKKRGPA